MGIPAEFYNELPHGDRHMYVWNAKMEMMTFSSEMTFLRWTRLTIGGLHMVWAHWRTRPPDCTCSLCK